MIRQTLTTVAIAMSAAVVHAGTLHTASVGSELEVTLQTDRLDAADALDPTITRGSRAKLERIDVYAADARILVPDSNGGYRELPRNDERYFISAADAPGRRFFVALSADGKRFRSTVFGVGGSQELTGDVVGNSLVFRHLAKSNASDAKADFQCAAEGGSMVASPAHNLDDSAVGKQRHALAGSLHQAIIAIDTDNELMDLKFSDITSAATTYLSDLFAGMNVMYERDLDVRLVQGTTYLRTSDVADPYSQTATNNQLNEVGGYWKDNHSAVNRAFVAFLSGKSPSASSGNGIAWVLTSGNYCSSKGFDQGGGQISGHYSATQIVRSTGAGFNVSLVGHEIGHNFGASHTHCTDIDTGSADVATNTIDQCFSGEGGCYSGPTSCPNDPSMLNPTQGSVMSYCHSCSIQTQFHPTQQVTLGARISTNIGNGCFTAVGGGGGGDIFANGFE